MRFGFVTVKFCPTCSGFFLVFGGCSLVVCFALLCNDEIGYNDKELLGGYCLYVFVWLGGLSHLG